MVEMQARWIYVRRWAVLAVPLAAGLLLTIALLMAMPADRGEAQAASANAAHVVVQFADGATAVRPITWTGAISRVAALKQAGFVVENGGDAVCSINGEGCPASDCFCPVNLWAQGQWTGLAWDGSAFPPPDLVDGDVIVFRMGTRPDGSDWGVAGLLPGAPAYVAASDALEWMRDQQHVDGSYNDGFSTIGASVRTLAVLGSAGYDPAKWGSPNLLDFVAVLSRTETAQYAADSAAGAGKLAVGAAWTGQTITDFAGINLPISITAHYSPATGAYGAGSGDAAWAMLGLYAMDEAIPAQAVAFLKGVQNADGGWAWNEWGSDSETQHTATCVQALMAAGEELSATEVVSALAFIDSAKNADGGYSYMASGDSDVSSSAYVLQAQLSAGQNPAADWCASARAAFLLSVQKPGGSYPSYSPLYATQEAIPALMHRPFGPLGEWRNNCLTRYLPVVVSD
jgi:hypothetical protein